MLEPLSCSRQHLKKLQIRTKCLLDLSIEPCYFKSKPEIYFPPGFHHCPFYLGLWHVDREVGVEKRDQLARVESQELRCSFLVQLFIFFLWHTWLCFQIVSSIDRGSTSPVSWLRFSDMKRSTWVLSEFSQVLSLQIKTWGFSFWRENVSAKDRTSTQFSRSRADSKYWEQSWTTHLIWKKHGD